MFSNIFFGADFIALHTTIQLSRPRSHSYLETCVVQTHPPQLPKHPNAIMPYVSPQRWRRITRSRLCSEHNAVCGPERFVKRPPGTDRPLFITFGNFLGAANYFGQFRQDGLQEHLPMLYSSLEALGLNVANLNYLYILYPPLCAEMALRWIFHKILRHELRQCRHRPLVTPDPGNPFDRDSIFGLFNQLESDLPRAARTMQLQPPEICQALDTIVRTIEIIGEFLGQFGCSDRLLEDFIKEAEFLVPMVCETNPLANPLANPWIGPWMYSLACSVFVASGLSTTTLLNFLRTVGWDERRQLRTVAQEMLYAGDPLGMIIAILTP